MPTPVITPQLRLSASFADVLNVVVLFRRTDHERLRRQDARLS